MPLKSRSMSAKKFDVFISYSREDADSADKLGRLSPGAGPRNNASWDRSLSVGSKWTDKITSKFKIRTVVVVIWSEHSMNSEWVRREIEQAMWSKKDLFRCAWTIALCPFHCQIMKLCRLTLAEYCEPSAPV